ncbi:MAG: hypothetical protein JXA22_01425 [Candidatus Thermoplasmatota archaeon]|nr:hypothetical protein [Candidatus Thermoplasmatota archaeon]
MKPSDVIQNLPLISPQISEDRASVEELLIKSILLNVEDQTNLHEIKRLVQKNFCGLDFPLALLKERLRDIENQGIISIEKEKILLLKKPEISTASTPIKDLINQFIDYLRSEMDETEWMKDKDWRGAFETIMYFIIDDILFVLGFSDIDYDFSFTHEKYDQMLPLIYKYKLPHPQEFIEFSVEFMKKMNDEKSEALYSIIQSSIQCYLLVRMSSIQDEIKEMTKDTVLFIDTNVIFGLMCPNDIAHILSTSAIEMSKEAGYSIKYMPVSRKEYNSLINAFIDIYESKRYFPKYKNFVKNPLASHYHDISSSTPWGAMKSYYTSFDKYLEENFGIIEWEGECDYPDEEFLEYFQTVYEITKKQLKTSSRQHRNDDEAAYHDSSFLLTLDSIKRISIQEGTSSPIGITFDTTLYLSGDTIKKVKTEYDFNLSKLAYWNRKVTKILGPRIQQQKQQELIKAVMDWAYSFKRKPNPIDYFFDALCIKLELKHINPSELQTLFVQSDDYQEFLEAYQKGDIDTYETKMIEILNSQPVLKLLKEKDEERSKNRDLIVRNIQLQNEKTSALLKKRIAETKLQAYQEVATELSNITINVNIQGLTEQDHLLLIGIIQKIEKIDAKLFKSNFDPLVKKRKSGQEWIKSIKSTISDIQTKHLKVEEMGLMLNLLNTAMTILQQVGS